MSEKETEKEKETDNKTKEITKWDDEALGLDRNVLRGIYAMGFESPSPIQRQAILPIIQGNDVLAQAQSGTGKTGAFSIGTIMRLDGEQSTPQAIILAPTRELAHQIHSVFSSLAAQTKLRAHLLVGGTSVDRDIHDIRATNPQVFVGCPGRVLDFLCRKVIQPDTLRVIVLDEADEILSQGFQEQIYNIFQYLTESVQVIMFSATIPEQLHDVVNKIMRNPQKILVKNEQMTLEGISQFYISFNNDHEKLMALMDLYQGISVSQSIIYCNSVKRVIELYDAKRRVSRLLHPQRDGQRRAHGGLPRVQGREISSHDIVERHGPRSRRAASERRHQLRHSEMRSLVPPPHRTVWSMGSKRCGHQFRNQVRHRQNEGHRTTLPHRDQRASDQLRDVLSVE